MKTLNIADFFCKSCRRAAVVNDDRLCELCLIEVEPMPPAHERILLAAAIVMVGVFLFAAVTYAATH